MVAKALIFLSIMALSLVSNLSLAQASDEAIENGTRIQPIYEQAQADFDQQHDKGWYLRMMAGAGFGSQSYLPSQIDDTAFRFSYEVSLGYVFWPKIALDIRAFGQLGFTHQINTAALGVTWYFGDSPHSNLYLSLGAGPGLQRAAGGVLGYQVHLGAEGSLGFFTWVSPSTSLGLSAYVQGLGFDLDFDGQGYMGLHGGVRLGVVFN